MTISQLPHPAERERAFCAVPPWGHFRLSCLKPLRMRRGPV